MRSALLAGLNRRVPFRLHTDDEGMESSHVLWYEVVIDVITSQRQYTARQIRTLYYISPLSIFSLFSRALSENRLCSRKQSFISRFTRTSTELCHRCVDCRSVREHYGRLAIFFTRL